MLHTHFNRLRSSDRSPRTALLLDIFFFSPQSSKLHPELEGYYNNKKLAYLNIPSGGTTNLSCMILPRLQIASSDGAGRGSRSGTIISMGQRIGIPSYRIVSTLKGKERERVLNSGERENVSKIKHRQKLFYEMIHSFLSLQNTVFFCCRNLLLQ